VGTADNYIALTESEVEPGPNFFRHLGLAGDDLDTVIRRLEAAGYSPSDASAIDSNPIATLMATVFNGSSFSISVIIQGSVTIIRVMLGGLSGCRFFSEAHCL